MKILLTILILLLSPNFSQAQIPLILAEACALLETATRRADCLKAAASGSAASPKALESISEKVENSFISLNGAIDARTLSHNAYQSLLLDLSKEIALYEQKPKANSEAVQIMKNSLETHQDALRFWGESIKFYANRDNGLAYSGGLPMKMVGLEWMIQKYGLPTRKSDIWGINQGVEQSTGLSTLWFEAKSKSNNALALLK